MAVFPAGVRNTFSIPEQVPYPLGRGAHMPDTASVVFGRKAEGAMFTSREKYEAVNAESTGLARIRFAIDEPSYWPGGAYSSCASTSIRTARSSPGRSAARTARPRGISSRIRGGGVPLPGRWCRSGGERYPRSAKMAERARESAEPTRGGGPAPCPACRWEGCGYGFHRRRRLAGAE